MIGVFGNRTRRETRDDREKKASRDKTVGTRGGRGCGKMAALDQSGSKKGPSWKKKKEEE